MSKSTGNMRLTWLFLGTGLAFFIAAILSRVLTMTFFAAAFTGSLSVEMQQLKTLWNLLMYIIPLSFGSLAAGFIAVGIIGCIGLVIDTWQPARNCGRPGGHHDVQP
ncbi:MULTISPECIES: hypothetical protein [unclassified Enterobacter]|uniref:hypothetical protein n=1 Tax=unclassified Enterobacter TaxID=2608935 RepID=UPI0003ED154F|nr:MULTISPECIES: hypothetical protein [unclassified Enterobacter]EWG67606.1 conjugal transfer protein TrbF [Enterobacter sp. DC4]EWG69858.1 conjugal transfer protein TrbF [Enterobacter sp. DC3]